MKKVLCISKHEDDERQLIGYPGFLFLLFYSTLGWGFWKSTRKMFLGYCLLLYEGPALLIVSLSCLLF